MTSKFYIGEAAQRILNGCRYLRLAPGGKGKWGGERRYDGGVLPLRLKTGRVIIVAWTRAISGSPLALEVMA